MTKYYYQKSNTFFLKLSARITGLFLLSVGIIGLLYVFFPIISLELFLVPVFASEKVMTPIPVAAVLSTTSVASLLRNSVTQLTNPDSSDATTWFPTYVTKTQPGSHHVFFLSIPKLGISNAVVSNADNDLNSHLVNYGGTAMPPAKGNTVVFGHSTIPAWFDPKNYKAIFATVHTLQTGDKLIASDNGVSYTYIIDQITIVEADDTSPLAQQYDDSYLTLITCTPPGTTWKRLVIHSRLEKLS